MLAAPSIPFVSACNAKHCKCTHQQRSPGTPLPCPRTSLLLPTLCEGLYVYGDRMCKVRPPLALMHMNMRALLHTLSRCSRSTTLYGAPEIASLRWCRILVSPRLLGWCSPSLHERAHPDPLLCASSWSSYNLHILRWPLHARCRAAVQGNLVQCCAHLPPRPCAASKLKLPPAPSVCALPFQ